MLAIFRAMAGFEADIRKERQADGIAKAEEAGVHKGRKSSVEAAKVQELHGQASDGPLLIWITGV